MCSIIFKTDLGSIYAICMAICGCFLGTSFLIAVLCISFISNVIISSAGSIYIGDMLGDSSALFEVNTPAIAKVEFEIYHENTIFETDRIPSVTTENLPPRQILNISVSSKNVYDLNYLRSYSPIYLLAGSSIQYNVTVEPIERLTSPRAACLYLFDDKTSFNNFVNSNLNDIQVTASHCFASNATYQHSFNITTDGVYYVGVEIDSGFTIQANASVVRKHYSTTGLEQICDHSHTCNVTVCNTFICTGKSTTYFLIQPTNTTDMNYTFSGPRLHGSTYAGFIATTVLGSLFCCCCCCLLCLMGMRVFSCCDYYDAVDTFFDCCEGCCKKTKRRRQRFERLATNDTNDNESNDNVLPATLQHRPVAATAPSRQIQQDNNNNNGGHHSRIAQETRGNVDSFDEDLRLALYLSTIVDTPWTNSSQEEERNTDPINPSLPSLVPIEEENNQNELGDQLPTESDDIPLIDFSRDEPCSIELTEDADPPKYWDVSNQEGNTTNLVEQQQGKYVVITKAYVFKFL